MERVLPVDERLLVPLLGHEGCVGVMLPFLVASGQIVTRRRSRCQSISATRRVELMRELDKALRHSSMISVVRDERFTTLFCSPMCTVQ